MTVDGETLWSSWFLLVHLKCIIYPRCSKAFAKEVDRGSRCQWQSRWPSGFGCVRKKTTPLDDWMDQFIPFHLTGSIGSAWGRNNIPPLEEDILIRWLPIGWSCLVQVMYIKYRNVLKLRCNICLPGNWQCPTWEGSSEAPLVFKGFAQWYINFRCRKTLFVKIPTSNGFLSWSYTVPTSGTHDIL